MQPNVTVTSNLHAPCRSGVEGRVLVPFKGFPTFPLLTKKEDLEDSPVPRLPLFIPGTSTPSVSSVLCSKAGAGEAISFSSPAQSISRISLEPLKKQTGRKRRRCWSQDLHIRFVCALQQLGGSQGLNF